MPITKSAKKALRQSLKRRERNLKTKRRLKGHLKGMGLMLAAGRRDEAKTSLPAAQKLLDKAAKQGILKKKAASRKKSRLAKRLKQSPQ